MATILRFPRIAFWPQASSWFSMHLVLRETGYNPGELQRMSGRGEFPQPVRISRRYRAFIASGFRERSVLERHNQFDRRALARCLGLLAELDVLVNQTAKGDGHA